MRGYLSELKSPVRVPVSIDEFRAFTFKGQCTVIDQTARCVSRKLERLTRYYCAEKLLICFPRTYLKISAYLSEDFVSNVTFSEYFRVSEQLQNRSQIHVGITASQRDKWLRYPTLDRPHFSVRLQIESLRLCGYCLTTMRTCMRMTVTGGLHPK